MIRYKIKRNFKFVVGQNELKGIDFEFPKDLPPFQRCLVSYWKHRSKNIEPMASVSKNREETVLLFGDTAYLSVKYQMSLNTIWLNFREEYFKYLIFLFVKFKKIQIFCFVISSPFLSFSIWMLVFCALIDIFKTISCYFLQLMS